MTKVAKFILRMPTALHRRLKGRASQSNLSLNQFCVQALSGAVMPSSNISAAITHPLDGVVQSAKGFFESRLLGVIVFGSFVRGEATGSSDVDLLFVLNSSLVPTKSLYKEWDNFSGRVSDIGGLPVSVNFVTLPKSSAACGGVWLEVALEGAVLFDPTLSVNRFLIEVREEITSQRVTSRFAHGQRYWVWKREAA